MYKYNKLKKEDDVMAIIKFIKRKYNFSGEIIYIDRNEYTIGTHRVILKSINTKIDNNIITDIVTYSIDYGDITDKLTVKSRNGKVLKIDEHNNHYNIMIEEDLIDKVIKKHRKII